MDYADSCGSLSFYMDYLTHDVAAADWETEVENMVCVTPDGNIDMSVLVFDSCLEDPLWSKWDKAIAWLLVNQYGDEAQVLFKDEAHVLLNDRGA